MAMSESNPSAQAAPKTRKPGRKPAARVDYPFPLKSRVVHRQFGRGVVQGYDGDKVTVIFENGGSRVLLLSFVMERSLLDRAS
jgi:ATP-dependent DNA helicase RecQ